jgi:hypothetical protein
MEPKRPFTVIASPFATATSITAVATAQTYASEQHVPLGVGGLGMISTLELPKLIPHSFDQLQ